MEREGSDALVDPLVNYWGLSLFPSPSLPPSIPYNSDQDLHTIHTHLTSMALRSPAKLVQQAKSIVDSNPQLFNSVDPTSHNPNDAEEDGEFRRQHRPGLGLKRPRFSIKPTKKPSVESLLPTLDLDSLKDPAEFFLAHERLENAKRELQKQLGGASFETDQDNASTRPRQRRLGLLGNDHLPIRYKHRYPREASEDVLSSQETLGSQSLDPVAENTDKGGACMASSENEVMDSSATEGNKLDELLDGLLCCNSEDLEGDGVVTLLQERLQIKPIALENFSVPDFPDNQVIDLKSLRGTKSKPRKALSDIDNLLKGMNNKTPLRKAVQCPVEQLASPTPPRSPFASLLSLQKHISQSRQSMDPFSAHGIDHLSSKNYSPTHMTKPVLNLVGPGKPSNELNANMIEDVVAVGKASTVLDTDKNCTNTSEISKEGISGKSSNKPNVPSIEDIIAVGGTSLAKDTVRSSTTTSQKSMVDNSREPRVDANIDSNEPHVDMDVDVGGSGIGKRIMNDTEDRSNIESYVIGDVIAVDKTITVLDTDINCSTSEFSKEDNSEKSSNKPNVPSIEDIIAVGGTSLAKDTVRSSTTTSQKSMVDDSREPRFDVNIDSNEPYVDMDVDIGGSGIGKRIMDDTEDRSNIEAYVIEDVIAVDKTITVLDTDINCSNTYELSKEDNSESSSNKLNVPSIEDIIAVGGTSLVKDTVRSSTTTQKSMVDNSREPGFDANIDSNEPHVDMDVNVGGSGMGERVMDVTLDMLDIEADEPCQSDKAENMQAFTASIPTDDTNLNVVNPLADQSNPAGYEANAMDKHTRRSDDDPEHCLQEKTDGPMVPVNGQKRVKLGSQKVSKEKRFLERQSLAAAGTSWTSGLRRSTRIRTRPLEYWKGERLVYGRVHQSLATVIGIKCMSPGSDGKPTMKVKSYVSDNKCKELLELASLY
ncbi:Centromere protein C, partial [Mucuna pruriens]